MGMVNKQINVASPLPLDEKSADSKKFKTSKWIDRYQRFCFLPHRLGRELQEFIPGVSCLFSLAVVNVSSVQEHGSEAGNEPAESRDEIY